LAHDRDAAGGVSYLEEIDGALGRLLAHMPHNVIIAVGADHTTSSETGNHTVRPPPALMCGPGIASDRVVQFDEGSLERAGAGVIRGAVFFRHVLDALRAPVRL
ncbi:MAG: hypothetical protein ACOC1F_00125, partial [Myxococcota bacterium]